MKYRLAVVLACSALVALAYSFRERENDRGGKGPDRADPRQASSFEHEPRRGEHDTPHTIEVRTLPKSDSRWTLRVLGENGGEIRSIRGTGDTDLAFALRASDWKRMEIRAPEHLGEIVEHSALNARGVVPLQLRALGAVRVHVTHRGNPVAGVPISVRYLGQPNTDAVPKDDRKLYEDFLRVTIHETDSNGAVHIERMPPTGRYVVRTNFGDMRRPVLLVTPPPGGVKDVTIALSEQVAIRGLVVDHRGKPRPNAEVIFIRARKAGTAKRAPFRFTHESRTKTNARGVFFAVGKARKPGDQIWIQVGGQSEGVAQVARCFVPPSNDIVDIGIVRPLDTLVTFVCRNVANPANHTMHVLTSNQETAALQSLGTRLAPLDSSGQCRIAGLPLGRLTFLLMQTDPSKMRMKGSTRFAFNGQQIILDAPDPEPENVIVRGPSPVVRWKHPQNKPATLIFVPHDKLGRAFSSGKGTALPLPKTLDIGKYSLFARVGSKIAKHEFTVRTDGCTPARIETWTMREGRRFTVRVVRDGKPISGATIKLQRFGVDMPRMSVFWGQTDDRGILELTGLPLDCKGISGSATEGGQGRTFEVTFAEARQPYEIDLDA